MSSPTQQTQPYALQRARELQRGAEAQAAHFLARAHAAEARSELFRALFLDLLASLEPHVPKADLHILRQLAKLAEVYK